MPASNGYRIATAAVEEDERLVNKPTTLLMCEQAGHPWEYVLTNGRYAYWIHEREGRKIIQVAEPMRCARCGTLRLAILWYDTNEFIRYKYEDRPEGATPIHIDGAPRLNRQDKRNALRARRAGNIVLVDAKAA